MSGFYFEGLDDVHEPEPVEDGFYDVEIVGAKAVRAEDGGVSRLSIQVAVLNPPEDNPNPPFIFHTLFPPREGAEEWQISNSRLQFKRFFHLFQIDAPDHDLDDDELEEWLAGFRGKSAKCRVKKVFNERMERHENSLNVPPLPKRGSRPAPAGGLRTV